MRILLVLFIFTPLLLLIYLIASWKKISSQIARSLIFSLISSIILFFMGIWYLSFVPCGPGWSGIIFVLAVFFIIGFILGICLYWISRLTNIYITSNIFKVVISIFTAIILIYILNTLLSRLGIPYIGEIAYLFRSIFIR